MELLVLSHQVWLHPARVSSAVGNGVDDAQASGSPTMLAMYQWLGSGTSSQNIFLKVQSWGGNVTGYSITGVHIKLLQEHYGLTADGTLDSPSPTIEALQNEINQYVG